MPFAYDGAPRRPHPGTTATPRQIIGDLIRGQRQIRRQMTDVAQKAGSSVVFNGGPSGPHANGSTVAFTVPSGSWYLSLRIEWSGTVTGGPTPQGLYAEVVPAPGPFSDARNLTQLIGPGYIDLRYSLSEVGASGGTGGVQVTLHAPESTSLDAEFTLTLAGVRAA